MQNAESNSKKRAIQQVFKYFFCSLRQGNIQTCSYTWGKIRWVGWISCDQTYISLTLPKDSPAPQGLTSGLSPSSLRVTEIGRGGGLRLFLGKKLNLSRAKLKVSQGVEMLEDSLRIDARCTDRSASSCYVDRSMLISRSFLHISGLKNFRYLLQRFHPWVLK